MSYRPLSIALIITVFIAVFSVIPASARMRERLSIGLQGGSVGLGSIFYQHETGKNYNNSIVYTAGSWYGNDLTLTQQSRRYFGELYLRPMLGGGLMETIVAYDNRMSVLVGVHGIAGIEYSFNDKVFICLDTALHWVLFDIVIAGGNEGLGAYLDKWMLAPGLSLRYAF